MIYSQSSLILVPCIMAVRQKAGSRADPDIAISEEQSKGCFKTIHTAWFQGYASIRCYLVERNATGSGVVSNNGRDR